MCVTYAATDSLTKRFEITRGGEWEMAVQLVGRDDFIGGYEHGDEYYTDFRLYIDGKPVNVDDLTDYTDFQTLRAVCVSDMFDPADHTTKVGIHSKEWEFNNYSTEVKLTQSIKWLVDDEMSASHLTMFPVYRYNSDSSLQITDKCFNNTDMTVEDCTNEGHSGIGNKLNDFIEIYSATSGVHCKVSAKFYPQFEGRYADVYNGSNPTNKLYFSITGHGSYHDAIHNGDIWKAESTYNIELS